MPNDYQVSIILANLAGIRSGMFVHQLALDLTVKTLVETYKDPIKQGLTLVKNVLAQCVHECCSVQVSKPCVLILRGCQQTFSFFVKWNTGGPRYSQFSLFSGKKTGETANSQRNFSNKALNSTIGIRGSKFLKNVTPVNCEENLHSRNPWKFIRLYTTTSQRFKSFQWPTYGHLVTNDVIGDD